jgi:hypothetical protein
VYNQLPTAKVLHLVDYLGRTQRYYYYSENDNFVGVAIRRRSSVCSQPFQEGYGLSLFVAFFLEWWRCDKNLALKSKKFVICIRVSTQTLFGLDFGFRVSTFWVLAKKPKTTFWLLRQILGKSQKVDFGFF